MRFALGAGRARIVSQLFVEALVLASIAAVVGLVAANVAMKWGMAAYYSGQNDALPFWIRPGLKFPTVIYAAVLTIAGAALLVDPSRAEDHRRARPGASSRTWGPAGRRCSSAGCGRR